MYASKLSLKNRLASSRHKLWKLNMNIKFLTKSNTCHLQRLQRLDCRFIIGLVNFYICIIQKFVDYVLCLNTVDCVSVDIKVDNKDQNTIAIERICPPNQMYASIQLLSIACKISAFDFMLVVIQIFKKKNTNRFRLRLFSWKSRWNNRSTLQSLLLLLFFWLYKENHGRPTEMFVPKISKNNFIDLTAVAKIRGWVRSHIVDIILATKNITILFLNIVISKVFVPSQHRKKKIDPVFSQTNN